MNTFSIKPGEALRFPSEYNTFLQVDQHGLKIDAIVNAKEHIQWFAIREVEGERVLYTVTKPDYVEETPLKERKHPKSDRI